MGALEAELPEQQFNTWVRPLQAMEGNGALKLLAPNRFVVDWINANLLPRIGELFPFLLERRRQRAGTLSGGEQKMLLVARALLARPRLMLIDEITEGLQPSIIDRLAAALRDECERFGTTILLIEQNVAFALAVTNRYAVLKLGEIVERGVAAEGDAEARINAHLSL